MSQTICEKRGGLVLGPGRVVGFGRAVYIPYFNVTPPLAKLRVADDSITFSAGPWLSLPIAMGDIAEVSFTRRAAVWHAILGGDTLTIRHRGRGPNPVRFSARGGLQEIADALHELGVRIVRN